MSTLRTGRVNFLRTTFVALFSLLIVGPAGFTPVAAGVPPTKDPNPIDSRILIDTNGKNPCAFPVLMQVATNKETVTTFFRRSGVITIHVTGALKVTLTNNDTRKSIVVNIPGPTFLTFNDDGSITQKATGPALWVFDQGIAPELPRLALLNGKSESIIGPAERQFRFISRQGNYQDLCVALAP
ncbi:MAG: hypothetical protein JWN06_3337 [Propionibacteriaceae bacterium]|jgi:hypothetical protein|nr:hypothetical protein [Propionibacteriaceae bacterium]